MSELRLHRVESSCCVCVPLCASSVGQATFVLAHRACVSMCVSTLMCVCYASAHDWSQPGTRTSTGTKVVTLLRPFREHDSGHV